MSMQELDKIYFELKEISAILKILANLERDVSVETIAIVACHYNDYMDTILNEIEKYL